VICFEAWTNEERRLKPKIKTVLLLLSLFDRNSNKYLSENNDFKEENLKSSLTKKKNKLTVWFY